jgi:oligopeptide transport system substrate-binding protein
MKYLALLCVPCLVVVVGCTHKQLPVFKQTAKLSIQAEPTSLDPRKARDLGSHVIIRLLFEGLMREAKDGSIEPALAKKIETNGKQYTFYLHDSKWSDGTSLTSKDFIFSWKSILDPQFPSDVAYHLYPIKHAKKIKLGELPSTMLGVSAPDDHTLCVELEQPTPYFLELLTLPVFFPVSQATIQSNPNWAQEADTYVSNGPFKLIQWAHSNLIQCVKNENYLEANLVKLRGLDLSVVTSDTGLRMFEENKLDWMGSPLSALPTDSLTALKNLQKNPFLATGFCRLNVLREPLSHPELRQALSLSLDRKAIVEHLLKGGQTEATSLVPKEMGLSNGYFQQDIKKARGLLSQLREPISPILISYSNNERNTLLAQTLQRQWQENLNIHVEIEAVEPKVFFQKISQKKYQIAIGSWTADFNDPINFLEVFKFKENGTNNTGWENQEYRDLLNQSESCMNQEERKELLRKAEKILMEEMPIIPIYHYALNYLKNEELSDVYLSPQGHLDLRTAYFR